MCRSIPFEKLIGRISYANSELTLKNTREKAVELLETIVRDLCIEKANEENKVTVKTIHNRKTILVDIQVEKSINNRWLVTMTPYL
jgi:hypothetical protein